MSFKRTQFVGAAVSIGLIVPASALAATIIGGPGSEHLRGTNAADTDQRQRRQRPHPRPRRRRPPQRRHRQRPRLRHARQRHDHRRRRATTCSTAAPATTRSPATRTPPATSPPSTASSARRATTRSSGGDSRRPHLRRLGQRHVLRRERPRPHGRRHRRRPPGRRRRQRHRSSPTAASTPRAAATATTSCGRSPAPTSHRPRRRPVGDTLDGGNGDDVFRTRDGEVDRITCGPGNDRALLDNVDVITDATAESPNGSCETVQRKARAPRAATAAPRTPRSRPRRRRSRTDVGPPRSVNRPSAPAGHRVRSRWSAFAGALRRPGRPSIPWGGPPRRDARRAGRFAPHVDVVRRFDADDAGVVHVESMAARRPHHVRARRSRTPTCAPDSVYVPTPMLTRSPPAVNILIFSTLDG